MNSFVAFKAGEFTNLTEVALSFWFVGSLINYRPKESNTNALCSRTI
jgi:hypothetical protein